MEVSKTSSLKYIFSTIKSSFLPALFLAFGLILFYAYNPYENYAEMSLHITFYTVSFISILFLLTINRSKPFFSLILGIISYITINWLKNKYGNDYISSPEYLWICFALPINLALFYFLPPSKLRSSLNKYLLIAILTELCLIQHFGKIITQIPYVDINLASMPMWGALLWGATLLPISIDISFKNTITNTGLFYADSCLFMALLYSDSATGLTTFFACFALILFITTFLDLYHRYYYDYLDGVGSFNSYQTHTRTKFPYKYSIGLFSVDNRDKLLKGIGEKKLQILEQMLINKIKDFYADISIYRYNQSEMILVFKNEDLKHSHEFMDNIRHTVAASEFIFNNEKSLKITISGAISEKTRKDLDTNDVITRAHTALQKVYSFNSNVTVNALQ